MSAFGTAREGADFFFEKQPNVQNKTLIRYLLKITETVTVTNTWRMFSKHEIHEGILIYLDADRYHSFEGIMHSHGYDS